MRGGRLWRIKGSENYGKASMDNRKIYEVTASLGEVMRFVGMSTQQPYNKRMPEDKLSNLSKNLHYSIFQGTYLQFLCLFIGIIKIS